MAVDPPRRATLDDGTALTVERFRTLLADEMERIQLEVGDAAFQGGRFEEARALFERISTQAEFVEFITLPGYELLEAEGEERARILACGASAGRVPPSAPRSPSLGGHRSPPPGRTRGCVARLRIEHTLAHMGATRLWELLHSEPYVHALGALTGSQAVQMVKAGLKAIYLSGGRSPPTPTRPRRPTRTRACTPRTPSRRSSAD